MIYTRNSIFKISDSIKWFWFRSRVGVAAMGGKLYAFGGFNGMERLSTVEIYDPKKNVWSKGSAMNWKRRLLVNKVYIK